MEVIGAAASVIAIGQAVAAVPKIVRLLRSVPNAKIEVASLLNELETVRLIHAQMEDLLKRSVGYEKTRPDLDHNSFPSVETSLLKRAVDDLNAVVGSLEAFCSDYRPECKSQTRARAKTMFRWLWNKHRVPELYQRTQSVRINLQVATNAMLVDMQLSHSRMLLDIGRVSHDKFRHLSDGQSRIQLLLEQGAGTRPQLVETCGINDPGPSKSRSDESLDGYHGTSSGAPVEGSSFTGRAFSGSDEAIDPMVYFEATPVRSCPPGCNCQCHLSRKRYHSPSWARTILGSLFLCYEAVPVFDRPDCDQVECQRTRSPATLQYAFPLWLCGKSLSLSASIDSLTNMGGTLHFTIGRLLDIQDGIWSFMGRSTLGGRQMRRFLSINTYLPTDCSTDGDYILDYALSFRNWSQVQILLQLWEPILRQKGCPRRITMYARRMLLSDRDLEPFEETILQKLIAFDPDADIRRPIHIAVWENDLAALQTAIREQPDSLDSLDDTGTPAVCIAADRTNIAAIRLLLGHGANVNETDDGGDTALITACNGFSVALVRFLIDAGSKLSVSNSSGDTALHRAAYNALSESAEMVELLLLHERSLVNKTNCRGETPLFAWARLEQQAEETATRKLRALRAAGCSIEARDEAGQTPLHLAIISGNFHALRLLFEAGASFCQTVRSGRGALHLAALYSSVRIAKFLSSLQLDIDTELEDVEGDTPWDCFAFVLDAEGDQLGVWKKIGDYEAEEFVRCFTKFRDRNLSEDIIALERIMDSLQQRSSREAATTLQEMIDRKLPSSTKSTRRRVEVQTCRTVLLQVREGMWDAAIEAVQENLEILLEEIKSSPWERVSRYDGRRVEYQREWLRRAAEDTDDTSSLTPDSSECEPEEDTPVDDD